MKKFAVVLTTLLLTLTSLHSQASFIGVSTDQTNFNAGDTVLLDLSISNISLDTAELGFNLNFDSAALAFDSFSFSDDVFNSAFLSAADLSFFDNNIVEFFVLWFDSVDLPGTSFSLGQASFTAQQASSAEFSITDAYLADVTGGDIDLPVADVSAPTATIIMLMSLVILTVQRKRFTSL